MAGRADGVARDYSLFDRALVLLSGAWRRAVSSCVGESAKIMSMGTKTALSPDDLLLLPRPENGKHYELSEGELIVVGNAGWRHERIKAIILRLLFAYLERHPLGSAFSETQFTMA